MAPTATDVMLRLLLLCGAALGFEIRTEIGKDFEAFCPKRHAVTRLLIEKGKDTITGERDLKWSITCGKIAPPDASDGTEKCRLKYRFAMPDGVVLFDNHWKSCTCDEYLAGVKAVRYRTVSKDGALQQQRMVQVRCCFDNKKVVNVSGCYYDESRFLLNDWDDEIQIKPPKKADDQRQAIQMIGITDNYIQARICPFKVQGFHYKKKLKYQTNKCWGIKKRGLKEMYNKMKGMIQDAADGKCKFPEDSPFGWGESGNSKVSPTEVMLKEQRLYKKQMHMCRDGNYMYAVHKYALNGTKGKDYIFLTRCHELVFTACKCKWKMNCTKPEDRNGSKSNKTMYIAGWRSKWDEEAGERKVEVLCCKSKGLKMLHCNNTKNYTDKDTSLVINRPRYKWNAWRKPKLRNGEIIRDISQWHVNGSLIMSFNICRVNGSDGDCEKKCLTCEDLENNLGKLIGPLPIIGELNITLALCTTTTAGTSTTTVATTTTATDCTRTEVVEDTTLCETAGDCDCITYCENKYGTQFDGGKCNAALKCVCGVATADVCKTNPAEPCECGKKFDFSLMIDESGSVGSGNFTEEKEFFKSFTQQFTISDTETRIAYTRFAFDATQVFDFTGTQTPAAVTSAITGITYTAGATHITAALEESITIFTGTARAGVPQIAILATDGRHNRGNPLPSVPAAVLKANGVIIFVVSIGAGVNQAEVEEIAGDPSRVFDVAFGSLDSKVKEITNAICNAVP